MLSGELSSRMFFDGWAPILRTLVIGSLAFIALIILLRFSGKRTLSKMNAFDFIVTIAFGSTLASALTSQRVSLAQGVAALALLIFLQWVATWLAVRSTWFSRMIKAEPTLVFFQGSYLSDTMRKQRVTKEEILAAMRQNGIAEPTQVSAVIVETEGSLSVIKEGAESADQLQKVGVGNGEVK